MRAQTYEEYKSRAIIARMPKSEWLTEEQWNARNTKLSPQKEMTLEREMDRYNEEPPEDM